MRAMLFTAESKDRLNELKEYAEKNPVDQTRILAMIKDPKLAIGNNKNHVMHIPHGFRVVYSIEYQSGMKLRHISVSVAQNTLEKEPSYPGVAAINFLLEQFGFEGRVGEPMNKDRVAKVFKAWLEEKERAINIIEECV